MDAEEKKLKDNFLAIYQKLKFSEVGKEDIEVVDIRRRCLVIKYLTAKVLDSEETASMLLKRDLKDYQKLMENIDGVNNYWKQFKAQTSNSQIDNDPLQWKSSLTDPNVALKLVQALPCQTDNTLPCKHKVIEDRDIKSIIDIWEGGSTMTRSRKVNMQGRSDFNEKLTVDSRTIPDKETETEKDNTNTYSIPDRISNENRSYHQANFTEKHSKQHMIIKNDHMNTLNNYKQRNTYKSLNLKPSVSSRCEEEPQTSKNKFNYFKSAKEELIIQQAKTNKSMQKKSLAGKGTYNPQCVGPLKLEKQKSIHAQNDVEDAGEVEDERLKNVDPKMIELIKNEIMDSGTLISWDDIAGLEYAKKIIKEVIVFPMLRPDIFTGLRRPPKGILLFGPPGTGKTLIGKCIASQSRSTFFSISASSLTSKWIGEGEKMVRALFAVARVYQPSVVFIDEIDSLLSQRSETEHESSRRLKTEFLVQLDGAATSEEDRILIVGATNRPHELDEAARRRLVKRLYVPLPELEARKQIVNNLLASVPHNLSQHDVDSVAKQSQGYSGADMTNLCKEASMGPIRSIPFSQLENIRKEEVRHVTLDDFQEALMNVRPSVSQSDLTVYVEWDRIYGTGTAQNYKI